MRNASGPPEAAHDGSIAGPRRCDVAIVGMACVMPGAPDVETFWANIVDGVDSVAEVSPERWEPGLHFDPDYDPSQANGDTEPMSVSKWGGWIPDVGFDALAWGIPPTSLASIDPAQLLALKVAGGALEDADYEVNGSGKPFDRDRTSLVFATGSGGASELPAGFLLRLLLRSHRAGRLPAELDAYLPRLTEDGLPGVLTSVIAGRVANRLDLGGKNLTVDSACASVLVALDIAVSELSGGSSNMVLCGGVDLHNGAQDFVSFTAAGALSPSGRCRAFDSDADGMTLAEGAGCVVLKRLDDAERDGDRIYAVVHGVGGSSDGRHLGLTAPRQEGQVKAVRRAYTDARLSPADIGLVEAHGTGTAAGDRTELQTMTQTFSEAGAVPGSVVMGTVKSNIGHIKCAAGIASVIKAARAAYHGVLPPTLHLRQPISEWERDTSPFRFLSHARPWDAERRLVGVSGFGFGGTNFHAILGNHRARTSSAGLQPRAGRPHWPAELFVFRAPDPSALDARLDTLANRLADELDQPARPADRWRLCDIAAAENSQGEGPVQLALVASDLDNLQTTVDAARRGVDSEDVYRPGADTGAAGASDGGQTVPAERAADDLRIAFSRHRHRHLDDTLASVGLEFGLAQHHLPTLAAAINVGSRHGLAGLLHGLAQLAVDGVKLHTEALHAGRGADPQRWLNPGKPAGWIVNGHYARRADGQDLPGGLRPASQAPQLQVACGDQPLAPAGSADDGLARQVAVSGEYLQMTQEIIAVAADLLRTGFSSNGASTAASPADVRDPQEV